MKLSTILIIPAMLILASGCGNAPDEQSAVPPKQRASAAAEMVHQARAASQAASQSIDQAAQHSDAVRDQLDRLHR